MSAKLKEVDAYIANAKPFAKPILTHLRKLVHKACPHAEEKMKWSMPHFDYKGQMMCSMAAFKEHCSFSFWKASLIDEKLEAEAKTESAMGHLGRIRSVKDIPSEKQISTWIKKAMQLNDDGIIVKRILPEKKEIIIPEQLTVALNKNKKAKAVFEKFPYSHKKEYIEWINEAKTEETRKRRIVTTIEWVTEGKDRNWKYRK